MSRLTYVVRRGRSEDCDDLFRLVLGLADHEKVENPTMTKGILLEDAFGDVPHLIFYVGESVSSSDKNERRLVAFASVEKYSHSIFHGRSSYLSGLFVEEEHRGVGLGRAIMREVAKDCLARGHTHLNLDVLGVNLDTRKFYASIGVTNNTEAANWEYWRFETEDMKKFVSRTDAGSFSKCSIAFE